jgi:hypothetical protein
VSIDTGDACGAAWEFAGSGCARSGAPQPRHQREQANQAQLAPRAAAHDREDFSFGEDFSRVWHEFLSSG